MELGGRREAGNVGWSHYGEAFKQKILELF